MNQRRAFDDPGFTLPDSPASAGAVLGASLLDNAMLDRARQVVSARDFFDERHRRIFAALVEMRDAGRIADILTLKVELERRGELEIVGGAAYVASLVDGVPKSAHVEYYARIVAEKGRLRKLIEAGVRMVHAACHRNGASPGQDLDEVRAAHEAVNAAAAELTPGEAELELVDLAAEPPPAPEPLVGDARQQVISPGDVVAVAGDPGVGKTMMLSDVALGCASGTTALGFACRQVSVLYVNSDGDAHIPAKLQRIWRGRGGSAEELTRLPLGVHAEDAFNLDDDACFGGLVTSLDRRGFRDRPGLLIVESLATNVGSGINLNDQLDVRRWATRRLRSLQQQFPGLTINVSAHLKKPQARGVNDLATRVAGSIQIRAAVDAVIGLVPRGRERFAVREVKRSRSGATFEPFEIRIEGAQGEPLLLRNLGSVEPSLDDLRGAAAAVMTWFRASDREQAPLKDIKAALTRQFRERAIEGACKRLSEAESAPIVRVSERPATYRITPKQSELELENLG